MNFADIAQKEYRNLVVFRELAKTESNPDFKNVLEQLVAFENYHYDFWRELADKKTYHVGQFSLFLYKSVRKIFGLTFTLRLLEMQEGDIAEQVRDHLFEKTHPRAKEIEEIILISEPQEQKLIRQIKEERVEFMGSIVLGLNDGLIELSGALTGFTFAFQHNQTVLLAGFILGISASLSMGSSAYLQARHERGKDPRKAALYVGLSYFLVLAFLLWPFAVTANPYLPLTGMVISIFALVAGLSFYTSVIFNRSFRESFMEMLVFSIGTAIVTFLIGTAARTIFGIQV